MAATYRRAMLASLDIHAVRVIGAVAVGSASFTRFA